MKTVAERVSVDKDDIGHVAWLRFGGWRSDWHVELDGAPVTKVITADPIEGWLLRNVTDVEGNSVLNDDRTDVVRETLTGNVTIRVDDRGAPR